MSWNIFVYAEVREKGSDKWRPLTDSCICDGFKIYDDHFIDTLPRMGAEEAVHPSVKSLNNDPSGMMHFTVAYCTLNEIVNHYSSVIDKFYEQLRSIYSALGVSAYSYEDELICNDEFDCCDENEYDSNPNFPWVKYMTFPVNKKLFSDFTYTVNVYSRALRVMGMCETVRSMCDNYDDEVRLLFATL